ncbi:MAG: T9SS type A sorting domain-containing protein [Spirosomaceae bacterium]|nr:T9SS type A sorting domain-containing protein [Spirosomataceae bacterium]
MNQTHTTFRHRMIGLIWVLGMTVGVLNAQIKITFPVERAVFQRSNANQATITVGGYYTQAVDRIEARLVPVQAGQGQPTDWAVIQSNPQGGIFNGTIVGRGGWYTLEVRAFRSGVQIGRDVLNRVGVGEVFVIAGQSNAEGIFNYGAPAATDDRVNCTTFNNRTATTSTEPNDLTFAPISAEGVIGPRGRSAWYWGALGDLLVRKLNVPVMFFNVAWESMTVKLWFDSSLGKPVDQPFIGTRLPLGMPYSNLRMVIRHYCSILGVRAILWQQGETDAFARVTTTEYQQAMQGLIDTIRDDFGDFVYIPWVLARSSRTAAGVSQDIINAQTAVISTNFNRVYAGPFTDAIQPNRPDGVHFQGTEVMQQVARAWDNFLTPSFFATVVPVEGRAARPLVSSCNSPAVSVNIKAPDGLASYRWNDGQTTQTITIRGAGTYQVYMKDAKGNTHLSPALTVTEASVQPPNPVITPSGEQVICADSSILLSINVSPFNTVTWSNRSVGSAIQVSQRDLGTSDRATFTASLVNVFGCASAVSAPVTVRTLSIKAPTVTQGGIYSLQAQEDQTIYTFADSKVSNILWDWRQGNQTLLPKTPFIKVTQQGSFSARSRVTFEAATGGSARTCLSPFSSAVTYQPPNPLEEGLIVYPNPNTTGLLSVEILRDLTNAQIEVYNAFGQLVFEKNYPNLNLRQVLNLTSLSTGMYVLKLTTGGQSQVKRFMIRR